MKIEKVTVYKSYFKQIIQEINEEEKSIKIKSKSKKKFKGVISFEKLTKKFNLPENFFWNKREFIYITEKKAEDIKKYLLNNRAKKTSIEAAFKETKVFKYSLLLEIIEKGISVKTIINLLGVEENVLWLWKQKGHIPQKYNKHLFEFLKKSVPDLNVDLYFL